MSDARAGFVAIDDYGKCHARAVTPVWVLQSEHENENYDGEGLQWIESGECPRCHAVLHADGSETPAQGGDA